jgi:hypothetical protein
MDTPKSAIRASALLAVAMLLAASGAVAEGDAIFERLKRLEGQWVGVNAQGQPNQHVMAVFKVIAAGHSVQETMFPGTREEMVNMYYRNGDAVEMVHYCAAGNQPRLRLVPGKDASVVEFQFLDVTNLRSPADEHMHDGKFLWLDDNHLKTEWHAYKGGKPSSATNFELVRKQ